MNAVSQAMDLIHRADYEAAADLLMTQPRDAATRNLIGVCYLRSGKIQQAVDLYRGLVLIPGSVTERLDVPDAYKRNFATALLLSGLPSGTLEVLQSTGQRNHPVAEQLRVAIKRWEQTLPFFRRLDWRLSRIEPPKCVVSIDFEPGELDVETSPHSTDEVTSTSGVQLAA